MANVIVPGGVKEQSIEVTVIRKDGTVENLGVVSYWHANPLKRWWYNLKNFKRVRGIIRKLNVTPTDVGHFSDTSNDK